MKKPASRIAPKAISHADQRNSSEPLPELTEEEAGDKPEATPAQIAKIVLLSKEQVKLERAVIAADEVLKKAKQALQNNMTNTLPKAMEEAHMEGCPLGNKGASVELDTIVTASIPSPYNKRAENAEERNKVGIAYMDKVAPSMINSTLTLHFPKGTEKELRDVLARNARRKKPLEFQFERTVNTASLGKWVRDQDKLGKAVDETALGVHRIKVAKVILPKKSKDKI